MSAYTFQLQRIDGEWRTHVTDQRGFCLGYFARHRELSGPRLAARVVDPKGKVIAETQAKSEVDIGLIVGMPSPEQYEAAAARALETARRIREQQAREDARRDHG